MKQNFWINKDLLDKVVVITNVDYYGELQLQDLENMIKDLVNEYHILEEKLEECIEESKEEKITDKEGNNRKDSDSDSINFGLEEKRYRIRWDEGWERHRMDFSSKEELIKKLMQIIDGAYNISVERLGE